MGKFDDVREEMEKARQAKDDNYKLWKRKRFLDLKEAADQADAELRYRTDKRLKHNRKDR